MTTASAHKLMSVEEFLALPDDPTVERMLIKGELWEQQRDLTKRSKKHAVTESLIAYRLLDWLQTRPEPRGEVASGEAGAVLRREPGTTVGIDVAYFPPEVASRESEETTLFDGPPVLAVEILSTHVDHDALEAKVRDYLEVGVKLVWVVDPGFRTVTVHRTDAHPAMFSGDEELSGEPHLAGFACPVSRFFQL